MLSGLLLEDKTSISSIYQNITPRKTPTSAYE